MGRLWNDGGVAKFRAGLEMPRAYDPKKGADGMDRSERYIRITTTQPRPQLYIPAVIRTMAVTEGQVYAIGLSDEELATLIQAKVAVEAPAGSFANYFSLRSSGDQFSWERRTT